jgi:excisionase family DNA binding protein
MENKELDANPTSGSKPATTSIDEAAKILGISRGGAYAAAKRKELPVIRIGRRLLVPRVALERMLGGNAA